MYSRARAARSAEGTCVRWSLRRVRSTNRHAYALHQAMKPSRDPPSNLPTPNINRLESHLVAGHSGRHGCPWPGEGSRIAANLGRVECPGVFSPTFRQINSITVTFLQVSLSCSVPSYWFYYKAALNLRPLLKCRFWGRAAGNCCRTNTKLSMTGRAGGTVGRASGKKHPDSVMESPETRPLT